MKYNNSYKDKEGVCMKSKLEQLILSNQGYITTKEVDNAGIHREYLSIMVNEGVLLRVAPGVYQLNNVWQDVFYTHQQKKKKLIYSHDTALYLHGLSDRDPQFLSVTLPSGYNTSQLSKNIYNTFTIKHTLLDLGKTTMQTPYGNTVILYDLERTICDLIRSRSRFEKAFVYTSIKRYLLSSRKDLIQLMKYAEVLGINQIVKQFVEILL
jgi:predicted transcriptional regulator of viral defense system